MKVLFNTTRTVQDGTGTTFKAGEVHDLSEASAERWVRRGVASPVADDAAVPVIASEPAPPVVPAEVAGEFDPVTADEDALRAFLEAKGQKPHHRAGIDKLREAAADLLKPAA